VGYIVQEIGLVAAGPFFRDRHFQAALWAGIGCWLVLGLSVPVQPVALWQVASWSFFLLTIWYPWFEEVIFRGVLQGQLRTFTWGRRAWLGLSLANVITSAVFVLGHFWRHSPLWALAVAVPSLVLGYFRDRYTSIYPSIFLHMFYNAGYFGLTGLP
jgi:membrane protease YdiL (CAAX protease family)